MWQPQHRFGYSLAALLSLSGVVSLPAVAQSESASDGAESALQCATLADQPAPTTPQGWFTLGRMASHCYTFQARAVRIGASTGVRTLAISHDIRDGVEHEVARFLDGPPVVHEHHGGVSQPLDGQSPNGHAISAATIEPFYRLSMDGDARIAGRATHILELDPLDDQRYGRRYWLDVETGIPLKQVLVDERGRALETFQITELRDPTLYRGHINHVAVDHAVSADSPAWQPEWLPSGFALLSMPKTEGSSGGNAQQTYGDGLSTLTLFVESVAGQPLLKPGVHRLGVSHAAVRHVELAGSPRQIVVMGEMPPGVLKRVAESVGFQGGAGAAEVSSSDVGAD